MRSINLGSASDRSIADDAAELAAIVLLIDNRARKSYGLIVCKL